MQVAIIEPYMTGSHAAWLTGYARHSAHEIVPLTLDGLFWKWRMHGGAVTLARLWRERGLRPDLLLATDMLDLTTFLALTRDLTHGLPTALYMHENQLTYPMRPGEKRDLHYGFINYASMLCAKRVFFNSDYHMESWFDELPRLLKHFPDHNELPTVSQLCARSEVLPLGLDLSPLDAHRPAEPPTGPALIVWNHRWEYDKNPSEFLAALYTLADLGADFGVALLGERFVRVPPEFEEARRRLGSRLVQFGYVESRAEYARWLWRADIAVSTAIHDYFGASVVEALYCNCHPILAHRLTYPQFVPPDRKPDCLYQDPDQLVALLLQAILRIEALREEAAGVTPYRRIAAAYDWAHIAKDYDNCLADLAQSQRTRHKGE